LEEAKSAIQAALDSCKEKGKKKAEACGLFALFSVQLAQGEPLIEILKVTSDSVKLFKEAGDKAQAGEVQLALAKALLPTKKEETLRWSKEALTTFKDAGVKAGQARALQLQATAALELRIFDAALGPAKDAMKLYRELKDKAGEAYTQYQIASVHLGNGEPQDALQTAKEAIDSAKAAGASSAQAAAMQVCAEALMSTGSVAEGKAMAAEALGLFDSEGADRKVEASVMLTLAKASMSSDTDEASQYAEHAMTLFLLLGNAKGELEAMQTAAKASLLLKSYDSALTLAMQSVVMAVELGDKVAEAKSLQMTSEARLAKGRAGEALLAARKAGEIYTSLKDRAGKKEVDKAIVKIEEKMPPPHRPTNVLQFPAATGTGAVPNNIQNAFRDCIIWNNSFKEGSYTAYIIELLKFIDDITKSSLQTQILICANNSYGRFMAQDAPAQLSQVQSGCVWGVVRTIRLEQPRIRCSTVDLSAGMDGKEIARAICDAAEDSGSRDEVCYSKVLDAEETRKKMGLA